MAKRPPLTMRERRHAILRKLGGVANRTVLRYVWWIVSALAAIAIFWVAAVLIFAVVALSPIIDYEEVAQDEPPLPEVCAGGVLKFRVNGRVRRSDSVVAVIENWAPVDNPTHILLDDRVEWRILTQEGEVTFLIETRVPPLLPGHYLYRRALGLNNPVILEREVIVIQCNP